MPSDRDTLAEATQLLRDPEIRAAMKTLMAHGIHTAAQFDAAIQRLHTPTEATGRADGVTLQCGQCGAVVQVPASPDGSVPIEPLTGWSVAPDQHVVRCPSCRAEEAGRG